MKQTFNGLEIEYSLRCPLTEISQHHQHGWSHHKSTVGSPGEESRNWTEMTWGQLFCWAQKLSHHVREVTLAQGGCKDLSWSTRQQQRNGVCSYNEETQDNFMTTKKLWQNSISCHVLGCGTFIRRHTFKKLFLITISSVLSSFKVNEQTRNIKYAKVMIMIHAQKREILHILTNSHSLYGSIMVWSHQL